MILIRKCKKESFMSQIAQHQNSRMYALSSMSVIFLLTGLLGINVGGMLGAENSQAFWIFVASLVWVIGFQFRRLRKFKWL